MVIRCTMGLTVTENLIFIFEKWIYILCVDRPPNQS